MNQQICYYEGCLETAEIRGLCLGHYNLWLGNVDNKGQHKRPLKERFWRYVWKPFQNDCWLWRGGLTEAGYGIIWLKELNSNEGAHRISWKLHYGDIPEDLYVLHKCDNPSCVNPEHLFLGTHADNMEDMVKKGCSLYGERNHQVKLTEKEVLEIRKLLEASLLTDKIIAKMFNVSRGLITRIKHHKAWTYLDILKV